MNIELFNVTYRPGLGEPPMVLLCQALDMAGEKFLWVDGINSEDPCLVSISAVRDIQWVGSFKEFVAARPDLAKDVLQESDGAHSPTIIVRSMLYMSRDSSLTAADALELAVDQALDIVDADGACASAYGVALKQFQMSVAA